MLYLVLFSIIFFLSLPLLLRVCYIIEFDGDLRLKIKLLFIKKTVFSKEKIEKIDLNSITEELDTTKDILLDLYKKFKSALKLKNVYIESTVATSEPYLTAISYGTVSSIIYTFIGFLDSAFSLKEKRTRVNITPNFLDTQSTLFVNLSLYTSLFSFVILSTYAFLKNAVKGGKNGRKQAKRNDKNRA